MCYISALSDLGSCKSDNVFFRIKKGLRQVDKTVSVKDFCADRKNGTGTESEFYESLKNKQNLLRTAERQAESFTNR